MTLNGVIALILHFFPPYLIALPSDYVTVVEDREKLLGFHFRLAVVLSVHVISLNVVNSNVNRTVKQKISVSY